MTEPNAADMELATELWVTMQSHRHPVRFLAEKLGRMRAALDPLADAVFNDNGDMTVSARLPTYDECVAAYFARKGN